MSSEPLVLVATMLSVCQPWILDIKYLPHVLLSVRLLILLLCLRFNLIDVAIMTKVIMILFTFTKAIP